jgi:cytochrome oxidase assembly protein ShyY1
MEPDTPKNDAAAAALEGRGYRFALRPKWMITHLFVLAMVVLMVNLGFWQLRRLDERRALNDEVRENASAEVLPMPTDLANAPDDVRRERVGDLEWHPVTVEGHYRSDQDLLVANRTLEGQPGYWLVTPLEPDDGSPVVAVVRGFVTRALVAEGDLSGVAAPSGPVTVVGYVQKSVGGGRVATSTGESGVPEVSRVDLGRLSDHWQAELQPFWLQLSEQQPAIRGETLTPVPLPPLDEGPHLSYAVQWFLFSAVAVVGYPIVLRRHARGRDDDEPDWPPVPSDGPVTRTARH